MVLEQGWDGRILRKHFRPTTSIDTVKRLAGIVVNAPKLVTQNRHKFPLYTHECLTDLTNIGVEFDQSPMGAGLESMV